jgi:site-specific DNA-cytosine methylase
MPGISGLSFPHASAHAWVHPRCSSLRDAMSWCTSAMRRCIAADVITSNDMMHIGTDRVIVTSTAFSGVGCPELADDILHNTWDMFITNNYIGPADQRPRALTFQPEFCIEWDRKCQAELALLPTRPKHLFGNILDAVPASLRRICGLDGGIELPPDQLKDKLAYCKPNLILWCVFCNAYCEMKTCHQHRAGSPCQDHSQLGCRAGLAGCKAKFFFIWVAICRALLFKIIVHENVPGFGIQDMISLLGDLYVIIRIELCPSSFGWASCRPRQACICLLRAWIFAVVQDSPSDGHAHNVSDIWVINKLDFQNSVLNIFSRSCHITFSDYLVSTSAEQSVEKQWARRRKLVRERRCDILNGKDGRSPTHTSDGDTQTHTQTQTDTHRQQNYTRTHRHTDRQKYTETRIQSDKHIQTYTHRHTHRQTETDRGKARQTDTHTHRHTDIQRHTYIQA